VDQRQDLLSKMTAPQISLGGGDYLRVQDPSSGSSGDRRYSENGFEIIRKSDLTQPRMRK
jgi:hypothetical protein